MTTFYEEQDRLSQTSSQEEYCPNFPTERLVAVDTSTGKLMCNQCIYKSDLSLSEANSLQFTSQIAGQLKDIFDGKFQDYKRALGQMHKV